MQKKQEKSIARLELLETSASAKFQLVLTTCYIVAYACSSYKRVYISQNALLQSVFLQKIFVTATAQKLVGSNNFF